MENNAGSMLADASRLIRRAFDERARTIGVTRPQWQVLIVLSRHEGRKQAAVAELLDVEPITLCRMVDRLEEAELVERRRDPEDRRAWQLFLLPRAHELLQALRPLGQAVMTDALDGFSAKEQAQLASYLERIRQNLARKQVAVGADS